MSQDDFMRLDDMEAFVREAERAANQEDGQDGTSSGEGVEAVEVVALAWAQCAAFPHD